MYCYVKILRRPREDDYYDANVLIYEVDISGTKVFQMVTFRERPESISFLARNLSGVDQVVHFTMRDAESMTEVISVEKMLSSNNSIEQVIEWEIEKDVTIPTNVVIEIEPTHVPNAIYISILKTAFDCKYTENDTVVDAHLRMAVVYHKQYNILYIMVCFLLFMFTGMMFVFTPMQKVEVEKLFLLLALLAGVAFAFINPFGQEPDGWVHFTRSMDVSEGNLLLPFVDNNGNNSLMKLPENIHDIGFRKINPNGVEGTPYMNHIKELFFSENLVEIEGLGGYASLFYLPQAIGIFIARWFGASVYGYMLMGRMLNLFTYIGLAYLGLKSMPIYKHIYMVIALLPMTLYQAASFSYDATLNGLCFLFIGLCFKYAYEKEELSWEDVIKLGIILALLRMCKYVYVCIGILVFIIPMKKFGGVKEYWKAFGIALIPLVLMLGYMLVTSMVPDVSVNNMITSETTQVSQLDYVMAHPTFAVGVFFETIFSCFTYYVEQLNTLGWLNYTLGALEFLVPVFMAVVAVLDSYGSFGVVKGKDKLIFGLTFVVVVSVGMIGLYLFDPVANPVVAPTIQGYQGRYTIPVLMLLLALFAPRSVENKIKAFSYRVIGIAALILSYSSIILLDKCY